MKPMLPTLTFSIPESNDWLYEVKYDGFRAILFFHEEFRLVSRNGNSLLEQFPELEQFLQNIKEILAPFAPLVFDGELVSLENNFKSNFSYMQKRGKMRTKKTIEKSAAIRPCQLLIFDLLQWQGKWINEKNYLQRKEKLQRLFSKLKLPLHPDYQSPSLLQAIPYYEHFSDVWENVLLFNSEGIVAKSKKSPWIEGKRTESWLKYKNWHIVTAFITAFDKSNGYYSVAVYQNQNIIPIGQVLFGFTQEEKASLTHVIQNNYLKIENEMYIVEPSICLEIKYLEWVDGSMREPHFSKFRFDLQPEDCTYEQLIIQMNNFPEILNITHPDKPLWEDPYISKASYLNYLQNIAPYILPFLKNRLLTVIRYPHGIFAEPFYQKNCPDYAPGFIETMRADDINYIICNDIKTLLWLGNQLAFEFHIPFQTVTNNNPAEIVFDLDPPNAERLDLAITAALLMKEIFDSLELHSFVKTSGSKGLQVYIPLPEGEFTFEDTRLFTEFIADYLVTKEPNLFTTERLKKNRGQRLYIDYVQHSEGKTIIAPYSPRGHKKATVAAPLHWEEVNDKLTIEQFQITNILERLNHIGDPFRNYFVVKENQNFTPVLNFLKKQK